MFQLAHPSPVLNTDGMLGSWSHVSERDTDAVPPVLQPKEPPTKKREAHPNMQGVEFPLQTLRHHEACRSRPIVWTSSHPMFWQVNRLLVVVVRFWYWITLGLVRFPFTFMIAGSLMKRFLRLTAWADILYLVVASTSVLVASALRDSIDQFLASVAVSSFLFAGALHRSRLSRIHRAVRFSGDFTNFVVFSAVFFVRKIG